MVFLMRVIIDVKCLYIHHVLYVLENKVVGLVYLEYENEYILISNSVCIFRLMCEVCDFF